MIIPNKKSENSNIVKDNIIEPLASKIFVANSFENVGNVFSTAFIQKHNITYDTNLICGEDYDFWAQMILKGAKIDTLDNQIPLLSIRRHNTNGSQYEKECQNTKKQVQQKFQKALNFFVGDNKIGECKIFMHFNEKYPDVFSQKIKDEKKYCPYLLKLNQKTKN